MQGLHPWGFRAEGPKKLLFVGHPGGRVPSGRRQGAPQQEKVARDCVPRAPNVALALTNTGAREVAQWSTIDMCAAQHFMPFLGLPGRVHELSPCQ
jgi:hypothetical protein